MNKQAPSAGRILTMIAFAGSCIGLLVFLWISFGGATPFAGQGYLLKAEFPSAVELATQADVRISGVPVGKAISVSLDQRTRITLFAVGLELLAGEDVSVVTAQAEDVGHKIYPLKAEYVGKVPGFDWLTQVVIRLPDDFLNAGDFFVSVSLRGAASNKVIIGIR